MKIKYNGGSQFIFNGKKVSLALNPSNDLKTDIVLLSKESKDVVFANSKVCDWPGEYEISSVPIIGVPVLGKDFVIYRFTIDDISICFLKGISEILNDDVLEKIGDIDVLLISIGNGPDTLDAKKAHDIFEDIDPRIVIPFEYDLENLSNFAKEFGSIPEALNEYEISKSALPIDKSEIVILNKGL